LDYFLDKFLWAITDTNPYLRKELKFIENTMHDMQDIHADEEVKQNDFEIESLDLKQIPSYTEMKLYVHRPTIIVKDRQYLDKSLEIDLGEISITSRNG
jgi:hypothetical protein